MMDNPYFDVISEGDGIKDLLKVIWKHSIGDRITHYEIKEYECKDPLLTQYPTDKQPEYKKVQTLILYSLKVNGATELPYPLNLDGCANFIENWLDYVEIDTETDDYDVHGSQGWRIFCEAWGHVNSKFEAKLAVQPFLALYGK